VTFKEEAALKIVDAEKTAARYRGYDWWQLSDEEESIFNIDFERFPRIITALFLFECFHRIADTDDADTDAIEAERQLRSDLMEKGYSTDGFQHFAKDYADMNYREADAVFSKHKWWNVRQGITRYTDEPKASGEE
jgi:hypothetical protein